MPKMKTHRAAAKRMRLSGTGKVMHKKSNFRHILEKKNSKRKRRLGQIGQVAKSDSARARRLLGG